MQKLDDEKLFITDILDEMFSDFSDWEDSFFSENMEFSDIENNSKSQNKSIQNTSKKTTNQGVSPLCREESSRHVTVTKLLCKKVTPTEFHTSIESDISAPNNVNKAMANIPNKKQKLNKDADSENFFVPNKKFKKTEMFSVTELSNRNIMNSAQKYFLNHEEKENNATQTPKSLSESIAVSSQNSTGSQKMIVSSQESSNIQKIVTSSQETCESQKMCQEFSESPQIIASSQESLGNQIMSISIKEGSGIQNIDSRQTPATQAVIISRQENSVRQNMIDLNREKVNYDRIKNIGLSLNVSSSLNGPLQIGKDCRRYNKREKRIIWKIRKKEILITKREKAVEIREKLLDAREADILKRESILKARERKFLKCKTSLKNYMSKLTNISSKK